MKLPPAALTAPSICPRCDAPAIMTDYCIACTLPLRRCGSCQGVAGPFDRYCGFCGYEIVRGERRLPVWRLWLLAALIPLVAGIAFGVSPYSAQLTRGVNTLVGASGPSSGSAAGGAAVRDPVLNLGYTPPSGWAIGDQDSLLVMSRWPPDSARAAAAAAAASGLPAAPVQASVIVVSRPSVSVPVDASDPQAVLAFEAAGLLQAPPSGLKIEITRQVTGLNLSGGRRGAEVVLRVTRADGSTWYYERAYLVTGSGLVRVEALAAAADWGAGDEARIEAAARSVRG